MTKTQKQFPNQAKDILLQAIKLDDKEKLFIENTTYIYEIECTDQKHTYTVCRYRKDEKGKYFHYAAWISTTFCVGLQNFEEVLLSHLGEKSGMSDKKRKVSTKTSDPRKVRKAKSGMKAGPVPAPTLMRTGGNFAQLGMAGAAKEKKYLDTQGSASSVDTVASLVLLNGCVPGSDAINRIGRRIHIKSLYLRAVLSAGATPTNARCRIMIVYDKQSNGAVAVATGANGVLNTNTVTAANNLNSRGRYVTLLDWMPVVDVSGMQLLPKVVYLRKNIDTVYNAGTAGTIADISTGSIYLLLLSNLAAGATAPVLDYTCRLRFEDD